MEKLWERLSVLTEHCRIPASHNPQVCEEHWTLDVCHLNTPAHHGSAEYQDSHFKGQTEKAEIFSPKSFWC